MAMLFRTCSVYLQCDREPACSVTKPAPQPFRIKGGGGLVRCGNQNSSSYLKLLYTNVFLMIVFFPSYFSVLFSISYSHNSSSDKSIWKSVGASAGNAGLKTRTGLFFQMLTRHCSTVDQYCSADGFNCHNIKINDHYFSTKWLSRDAS